jgi:DNA helicase-2/ATP-dependent DNA helicase PcrA
MPEQPYRATLLGTVFHEWVERRAKLSARTPGDLLEALENRDDDDRGREGPVDEEKLRALQATFIASEWGSLKPIDVEREIHIVLAGVTVVCKIDAVYRREHEDGTVRLEIVDWKTGLPPRDDDDYELKQTQLALYAIAYARWVGVDVATVDAAFYFVADDVILRPDRLLTEQELVERWMAATS